MTVEALLKKPRTALFATAGLWVFSLSLAVLGFQIWTGHLPPVQMAPALPFAPTVLGFPLFRACGWFLDRLAIEDSPLVPIAVGVIWISVLVGYWGSLAWLSWSAVAHRSRPAFITLGAALGLSSPFWLVSVAWMASV